MFVLNGNVLFPRFVTQFLKDTFEGKYQLLLKPNIVNRQNPLKVKYELFKMIQRNCKYIKLKLLLFHLTCKYLKVLKLKLKYNIKFWQAE